MSLSTYFENPKSYWLRWIGIFPIAIVSYELGYVASKLIILSHNWLFPDPEGDTSLMVLGLPIIATSIASYYSVKNGSSVAPIHKKNVALILLMLIAMVSGVGIFTAYLHGFKWASFFEAIGNLVGSFIAFKSIENTEWLD